MLERVKEAGRNVHMRMTGTLASDIWEAPQGHDEAAEDADYELLAGLWRNKHRRTKDWTDQDCAEAWVRENLDELLGAD